MKRAIYPALLERAESGGFAVRVPDVRGCATTGDTMEDALDSIKDALAGCLCVLEDVGKELPAPSAPEAISGEGTVILVDVDLLAYRQANDNHAVRKNVSLPAWLATMADREGLNCSKLLQKAIKRELQIA